MLVTSSLLLNPSGIWHFFQYVAFPGSIVLQVFDRKGPLLSPSEEIRACVLLCLLQAGLRRLVPGV